MKFRQAALLTLASSTSLVNGFVAPQRAFASTIVSDSDRTATAAATSALKAGVNVDEIKEQWMISVQEALKGINGINSNLELSQAKTLESLLNEAKGADASVVTVLQDVARQANQALHQFLEQQQPSLLPIYDQAQTAIAQALGRIEGAPTPLIVLGTALGSYAVISSLLSLGEAPPTSRPYPVGEYNPTTARGYFDKRPLRVIKRGVGIALDSLTFGVALLKDFVSKEMDQNAEARALQLSKLLTKLGPSFIKIGQSLSIRTDILSPAYVRGLQTLQDQCPPFDSKKAKEMLKEEWGVDNLDSVLSKLSAEPVAAASLGQVYKGTLLDGREVAIKVQRPDIMEQIALDMHFLREMAPIARRTFNLNTDTVGTVDVWGEGFVAELDYVQEAKNAQTFMENIKNTPLSDVVFAPPVVEQYSTGKVLTTEWVDGERLDKSPNEDVTVLCSIAMNAYLTMMLEIGVLHCDPHPGNLLRSTDGRLCILDWGMVTRLDKNLQLTLIEHMAHLTSADYEEIPKDLLLLGFIPEDKADLIKDSGVVETLADIYGAWTSGGGVASINVNKVVTQLQDLTATRGNLFQIPPYFAYIAKSFSVLEGIGLSNDSKYSIINECLPYVSKRLLTDKSERTGGALSTFIFGPDKKNIHTRIIDYDRVEQLVTGFGSYSTSASGALLGNEELSKTQVLENTADQILDLVVSEEETPLQTIFVEQLAKIIASSSRSVWTDLRERSGTLPSGRSVLGTLVDPLGFWRTSPIVRMNESDLKIVDTTRNLIQLLQMQAQSDGDGDGFDLSALPADEVIELSSILVNKVWERRVGVVATSNRLANQLLKMTADKLERGDRDVMTLPTPAKDSAKEKSASHAGSERLAGPQSDSNRLKDARQRLFDIESDDSSPEAEAPAPVQETEMNV